MIYSLFLTISNEIRQSRKLDVLFFVFDVFYDDFTMNLGRIFFVSKSLSQYLVFVNEYAKTVVLESVVESNNEAIFFFVTALGDKTNSIFQLTLNR